MHYRDLQCWWAQTLEAKGLLKEAEVYYALAKDYLSLVRVYCCLNREEAALELCNETGDKAACYHLARQFESKQDVDRAIHLFTRARAYSSAIRICQAIFFKALLTIQIFCHTIQEYPPLTFESCSLVEE